MSDEERPAGLACVLILNDGTEVATDAVIEGVNEDGLVVYAVEVGRHVLGRLRRVEVPVFPARSSIVVRAS